MPLVLLRYPSVVGSSIQSRQAASLAMAAGFTLAHGFFADATAAAMEILGLERGCELVGEAFQGELAGPIKAPACAKSCLRQSMWLSSEGASGRMQACPALQLPLLTPLRPRAASPPLLCRSSGKDQRHSSKLALAF